MTILPKIKIAFGEGVGVEIFIEFPDIAENNSTFINTDVASAASSYTVDNGLKFSAGQYVLIGNRGAEKAEIDYIHTSTNPTATTITLNANSSYAHSRGEKIQFIPYNQIEIEKSTDSGVTYANITTLNIRADSETTYYNWTTGVSTDYYRVRFKNEADTTYSQYSDGLIATGYVDNSVGAIISQALNSMGEAVDNEVLTKEFLYEALNEGREEIDRHEMIERWSFRNEFDYDAGNIIPGQYKLTLPTNLRDSDTFKNILSLRLGVDGTPLISQDKRALNRWYRGVAHTTLNGAVLTADTSIVLTSSGDFDENGSVDIASATVTGAIDNVNYTANAENTNTISGVTNIATGGHATLTDVWQGASFGLPTEYTVDNGVVIFNQPFADDYAGENIWMDYYKSITRINSDADLCDEPFYKIFIPYMRYRIKKRKNPQLKDEDDSDYKDWIRKREAQVNKEFLGQDIRINIDLP